MKIKKIRMILRPLIVAMIVLCVMAYFINICWIGLNSIYVEESWQATSGTILNPEKVLTGKKNSDRVSEGIEQTINYKYSIDGVEYESNSVSKETFANTQDYPEGKIVNVYYNPNDATESVLIRSKVQKQNLYIMIVFCVLAILGTLFFLIKDIKYVTQNK